jgi:ComF family protein
MGWFDWLVVLPCPLCQRPAQGGLGCFCQDCAGQLQSLHQSCWQASDRPDLLPIYAWGIHQALLRRALHVLKYDHQPRIGLTLGEWMGQDWCRSQPTSPCYTVVPIPLHADRFQKRGYNQAELLSRSFSAVSGLRHQPQALVRCKSTQAQYGLSVTQRQHNLDGAFRVTQPPRTPVLIVDDIYTTGSTVAAACQALGSQGVEVVGIVVAARAVLQPRSAHQPITVG